MEDQVVSVMGLADSTAVSDVRGPLTASMGLDTGKVTVQLPSNASYAPAPITQESARNSTKKSTSTYFTIAGAIKEPV